MWVSYLYADMYMWILTLLLLSTYVCPAVYTIEVWAKGIVFNLSVPTPHNIVFLYLNSWSLIVLIVWFVTLQEQVIVTLQEQVSRFGLDVFTGEHQWYTQWLCFREFLPLSC